MKRIIPPIFVLLLVMVIAFAAPTDAHIEEQQPVELMTETVLHTNSLPEPGLAVETEPEPEAISEPEATEADDGLLTTPSGLSAEDLHLYHDLVGLEQAFIDAEAEYGVRADFLAAVAALESGWGRYQFRPNNIMGFGRMEFSSMEECIDTVAAYLAKHYLNPNGKYYNGETVKGVCVRYNGNPEWAEAVHQIMEEVRS